MGVAKTFISYTHADRATVEKLERQVAHFGVQAWRDVYDLVAHAGEPLGQVILERIRRYETQTFTLFVSKAALESQWVRKEVKEVIQNGRPLIPIMVEQVDHALQEDFKKAVQKPDLLYLRSDDPDCVASWAATALRHAGVLYADDVVLHLGHRDTRRDARGIPEAWSHLPAIDLRQAQIVENTDYSPSKEEWTEIWAGVRWLRRSLRATQIRVCGFAPLGVAAMVGAVFDRGCQVELVSWNPHTKQEWSVSAFVTGPRRPGEGDLVELQSDPTIDTYSPGGRVVLASFARDDHLNEVKGWFQRVNPGDWVLIPLRHPVTIDTPAQAEQVAVQTAQAFAWVRQEWPDAASCDWICGLPLALAPLATRLLRAGGMVRFLDQVKGVKPLMYREAFHLVG